MQNHTPSKSNYAVQDVSILIAEKLIYCGYVVKTAITCRYFNYMYLLLLFFICLFIFCCVYEPRSWRGVLNTTYCQWLATGRWISPGPLVSSINKTDRHDIIEILLKMALSTITLTLTPEYHLSFYVIILNCTPYLYLADMSVIY